MHLPALLQIFVLWMRISATLGFLIIREQMTYTPLLKRLSGAQLGSKCFQQGLLHHPAEFAEMADVDGQLVVLYDATILLLVVGHDAEIAVKDALGPMDGLAVP